MYYRCIDLFKINNVINKFEVKVNTCPYSFGFLQIGSICATKSSFILNRNAAVQFHYSIGEISLKCDKNELKLDKNLLK